MHIDRSVNLSVLVMLLKILTMILMVTVVNCQPPQPLESDTTLQVEYSHQSRHRRRLHAAHYIHGDDDNVGDAWWLWMSTAAAAGLTSLITVFALCTCCLPYRSRRCVQLSLSLPLSLYLCVCVCVCVSVGSTLSVNQPPLIDLYFICSS